MTSPDDTSTLGYAEALAELESILGQLEDDDVDVDVLSTKVARAAVLIRLCRGRIRDAQLQVSDIVADLDELACGAGDPDVDTPGADVGERS